MQCTSLCISRGTLNLRGVFIDFANKEEDVTVKVTSLNNWSNDR